MSNRVIATQNETVAFGLIDESDIELFVRWFNDWEMAQYLNRYLPMYPQEELEWIQNLPKRIQTDLPFVILVEERPIGTIGLHRIDYRNRCATVGIAIGEPECREKGYGTKALELLLDYGFARLNLNRIGLSVLACNKRALRCYEKCGFKVEGQRREQHFRNGTPDDEIIMGILAREFFSPTS